ncbi:MAG TPA: hypothetical protein VNT99_18490 [Methylomirabilota bacterium]|nr:hypothetical protein [Methylomirabilota bacterium]
MTASELIAAVSPALSQRILEEVHASDKDLYRVAVAAVAQAKKVRAVFLERQPRIERHRTMIAALKRPEFNTIAGNVLSGWLVKNQSALLIDFLDALKIQHEKGVVEDLPKKVEDADLNNAVNLLLGKYPPEIVALYLRAFHDMNEADWPNLQKLLNEDSRLQFGAEATEKPVDPPSVFP